VQHQNGDTPNSRCAISIADMPVSKARLRRTRELIIHGVPYFVPYRIKRKEIRVLCVYHTSGKWPESFE
jgi:hypothetical protein